MTIDRLSDRYRKKTISLDFTNEAFRIYMQDHKENIIQNSTLHTFNPDEIAKYEQRPMLFLKETYNLDHNMLWIFLFINNLNSSINFNITLSTAYIPDESYITKLKQTYKAIVVASKNR